MQGLHFITKQTKLCHQIQFHHQINGGNQSTINQTTHKCVMTMKKIVHHMISDEMLLVAKVVVTKILLSPIVWQQNIFSYHPIGDKTFLVIASLVTENFPS
jgi:hypothetical protein